VDLSRIAALVDDVILLGRIRGQLRVIEDQKIPLSHSELYVFKVIAILSKGLTRDKIPVALIFRVLPYIETSTSRTITSLENKGFIKRIYEKETGEEKGRRRIYLQVTPEGLTMSDLIADYDRGRINEVLTDVIEQKMVYAGIQISSFISEAEYFLEEFVKDQLAVIEEEEKKPRSKGK